MDRYFNEFKPYKDGIHNDGEILSHAIEVCSKNKERLIIESGTYKCGTIYLTNNTSLYLEKGVLIKLSDEEKDFFSFDSGNKVITRNTWADCTYNGKPSKYFIYG